MKYLSSTLELEPLAKVLEIAGAGRLSVSTEEKSSLSAANIGILFQQQCSLICAILPLLCLSKHVQKVLLPYDWLSEIFVPISVRVC